MNVNIAFLTDKMIVGHGVDLVVDRMADGLSKRGYNCKVYCHHFDETFTKRKSYNIITIPPPEPANPLIYEKRFKKLSNYFNSKNIDLFIIQSFPFYSLTPLLKKPVLIIDYGIISTENLPLKRRLFYNYMKFSQNLFYFRKAYKIICISRFLLNLLPAYLRKKATCIYNGCDHYKKDNISKEEIKNFRQNLKLKTRDILLLFVGRLNPKNQPYKGIDELIKIYHKLSVKNKNVKLLAVGYGSKNDEENLKNQGILSISNAPEELMPLIFSSSDIYVTCSHWEGFNLPAVEAQSFGKPVICYDIGAHPEVVLDGKTGFTVKNKEQFFEKLELLVTNKVQRKQMGENAEEYIKKFSWDNTIDRYEDEIKKILNLNDYKKKLPDALVKNKKEITAIIINYNSSYSCLKECIGSLKNQTFKNMDILIFDNNSENDTINKIEKEYKNIKIIHSDKNVGLGNAINISLNSVESKFILISSFDVVYDKTAVEEFVEGIKKLDDSYLGLAPKIKFLYQKDYIENVGLCLDDSFYIGYQGIGQLDLDQYNKSEDILSLSFTSAFLKTLAFSDDKAGKIDPTFFLFYEDIDFCYRANLFGFKFKSCPSAVCYHRYAYSFRDDSTSFQEKYYYQKLNLLKTVYKNAEDENLKRILEIELGIQKDNLKDKNLRQVAKKILKNFKNSLGYLKEKRKIIQPLRKLTDRNIFTYLWGEYNFFDFVKNTPIYSIQNLQRSYQRLYVITGSQKYGEYVSYLENLDKTKFKIQKEISKKILHHKLEYEPESVHRFIDHID